MDEDKPLKKMAEAFKELSIRLDQFPEGEEARLELSPFSNACSLVSPLFRCLGIAFKFAELDYVAKVIQILFNFSCCFMLQFVVVRLKIERSVLFFIIVILFVEIWLVVFAWLLVLLCS